MSKEKFDFQAEVGKILNIVANSLYSDKEIFVREYISNASDACDKLRYELIKNPKLLDKSTDFRVSVNVDKENKVISFTDNGIGMNKTELISSLGTIAKSGTEEFIKKLESEKNKDIEQIGRFGVGFYSGFMVASEITVDTKKAGDKKSWIWRSDGKGSFEIEEGNYQPHGTKVTLKINKENKDFLEKVRLQNIIKKYSDHISHSVCLKDNKDKEEQKINDGTALWTKDKKDIKSEDYDNFYSQLGMHYDKPWKVIHNRIEGKINFTNLLFIPTEKPFDLLNAEKSNNLKLYIKKVFITENCENILPKYLRFISGIIDSEDISLNISREMLQNDPVISKIRINLIKKVLSELKTELSKSKNNYIGFWEKFGAVLKEGIHEDFANKENILDLSLFQSSKTNTWTTILEYVDRIRDKQDKIYYISGDNVESLKNSPQMEAFIKNDIEVLFFTDPVDEFWLPNIEKYKDLHFKSITKGNIDLDNFSKKEDKQNKDKTNKDFEPLIKELKIIYGDKVKDVKISDRLTNSPVCFVAEENEMDIHLENLLKKHKHLEKTTSKVLEINTEHGLIKYLFDLCIEDKKDEMLVKNIANILIDQAKIIEGIPLEDSRSFCDSLNDLLIRNLNPANKK